MRKFSSKASWVKTLTVLLVLVAVIGCKEDDNADDLIGTWVCVHGVGYEKEAGSITDEWDYEYGVDDSATISITFNADGTCVLSEGDGQFTSQWKYSGNQLTLTHPDEVQVVKVESLTSSRLVILVHEKDGDYEYYSKSTFVKVG